MKYCIRLPLLLLVVTLISTGFFCELMAQTIDSNTRMITVSGEGKVNTLPDMATVRFGIVTRNEDPERARRMNAETAKKAMNVIRDTGVEESKLSLQTLRLQPVREYDPQTRKQIDRGYEASRELVVVIEDLDLLPSVIAKIVQQGANRLNGISYGVRDQRKVRDEALIQALERARAKAELMASTLGVEIGNVLRISEQNVSMPTPVLQMETAPRVMMAKSDAAPEPEAYSAGEIEVRAVVQVIFQLQ